MAVVVGAMVEKSLVGVAVSTMAALVVVGLAVSTMEAAMVGLAVPSMAASVVGLAESTMTAAVGLPVGLKVDPGILEIIVGPSVLIELSTSVRTKSPDSELALSTAA